MSLSSSKILIMIRCCYKNYKVKFLNEVACVVIENNEGRYMNNDEKINSSLNIDTLKIDNKSMELILFDLSDESRKTLNNAQQVAIVVTKDKQWLDLFIARLKNIKHPCLGAD